MTDFAGATHGHWGEVVLAAWPTFSRFADEGITDINCMFIPVWSYCAGGNKTRNFYDSGC